MNQNCSNPFTVWCILKEGHGGTSVLRATLATPSFDARNALDGHIRGIGLEFGFLTILWIGIPRGKQREGFSRLIDIYDLRQGGITDASRPTLRIWIREWTVYTPYGCFIVRKLSHLE
jgi:hypothetical protein